MGLLTALSHKDTLLVLLQDVLKQWGQLRHQLLGEAERLGVVVGEVPAADIGGVAAHCIPDQLAGSHIASYKTRAEFAVTAQDVIHDQNLPIAYVARANPNGRDP